MKFQLKPKLIDADVLTEAMIDNPELMPTWFQAAWFGKERSKKDLKKYNCVFFDGHPWAPPQAEGCDVAAGGARIGDVIYLMQDNSINSMSQHQFHDTYEAA